MVRNNMTNEEIYTTALDLSKNVANANLHLPVKVNFYLQKNVSAIVSMAEEIEKARNEIFQKYGTADDEGTYQFANEVIDEVNHELGDLFSLEQEVPIYEIALDDFGNTELDSNQVRAISYMIKDEEE